MTIVLLLLCVCFLFIGSVFVSKDARALVSPYVDLSNVGYIQLGPTPITDVTDPVANVVEGNTAENVVEGNTAENVVEGNTASAANALTETVQCVGAWENIGICTKGCGGGKQSQEWKIITPGENCEVPEDQRTRETDCNTQACVQCVGAWQNVGTCTKGCGGGKQSQEWTITTPGENCEVPEGSRTRETDCNTQACVRSVDCLGSWGDYGRCDKACGTDGIKKKRYTVHVQQEGNGKHCTDAQGNRLDDNSFETAPCNRVTCTVDADCVGQWSGWSSCSKGCGTGTRFASWITLQAQSGNGKACLSDSGTPLNDGDLKYELCNQHACETAKDVDCEGEWGPGPYTCRSLEVRPCGQDEARVERYRIKRPKENNGKQCPHRDGELRKVNCGKPACKDTDLSAWKPTNRDWYIANKAPGSSTRTFWLAGAHTLDECKAECSYNNTLEGHPQYVGCSYIRFKPEDKQKCWFSNSLSASAIQASKTASAQQLNVPEDGYGFVNPEARLIRNYIE
jgi:hypothetical protein